MSFSAQKPPPSTTTTPITTPTAAHESSAATSTNPTQDPQTDEPDHPDHDPRLSPLEAEVLTEYAKLRSNLEALNTHLSHLSSTPSSVIADGLRLLERKTSLVCTALKSSVYGIVLQQQIEFAGDEG